GDNGIGWPGRPEGRPGAAGTRGRAIRSPKVRRAGSREAFVLREVLSPFIPAWRGLLSLARPGWSGDPRRTQPRTTDHRPFVLEDSPSFLLYSRVPPCHGFRIPSGVPVA